MSVGYSHRGEGRNPIEIAVRLPKRDLAWTEALASTPVPANTLPGNRTVVELGEVVRVTKEAGSPTIFRRDGRFADMVMAELAGAYEAPIYGMLEVAQPDRRARLGRLAEARPSAFTASPRTNRSPPCCGTANGRSPTSPSATWAPHSRVAILGIYVLVVAQFGSFRLPLVILTPIPLTLIGIVLGHWLFGAPFTATSMIGFIALAGIIVRNSILLVDFIRHGAGRRSARCARSCSKPAPSASSRSC